MSFKARRNISMLFKHFVFTRHIVPNIKQQANLARVLKPLKKRGLISYRTYLIHLFSYVSRPLGIQEKAVILANHYTYVQKKFDNKKFETLFTSGIECFREDAGGDIYSIVLAFSSLLEFEGSLLLNFNLNDVCLSSMSLTVVPGKLFNVAEENIIYISCVQRDGKQLYNCSKAKKHFKNISLSALLMAALNGIAGSLQIKHGIGISARNQLSLNNEEEYAKFNSVYDQLWLSNGAEPIGSDYLLTFPIPQPSLADIPKNQKEAVLAKRYKLQDISEKSYAAVQGMLA